jgi:hypothetical protein
LLLRGLTVKVDIVESAGVDGQALIEFVFMRNC